MIPGRGTPKEKGHLPQVDLTKPQQQKMDKVLKHSRFLGSNRDSFMDTELIRKIHEDVKTKYNLSTPIQLIVIIGLLCQLGGTSAGCDGNFTVSIDMVDVDGDGERKQVDAKLKDIKIIFAKNNQKNKLRKYAKTMQNPIYDIVKNYGVTGNLANKIAQQHPEWEFTTEEKVGLSDFLLGAVDLPDWANKSIKESFNQPSTQKRNRGKNKKPQQQNKTSEKN